MGSLEHKATHTRCAAYCCQNGSSSRSSKNTGRFGIKDRMCAFTRSVGVVKANNRSWYASAGDSERTVSYVSTYSRYDSYFSGPSDESFILSPRHASLCIRYDAEMTTEFILWRLQYATNCLHVIMLFVLVMQYCKRIKQYVWTVLMPGVLPFA